MRRRTAMKAISMALLAGALPARAAATSTAVKVYKSPTCGCCTGWVDHMRAAGFAVTIEDTGNVAARSLLGIPARLGSCHTAEVGGYAIEGHVPAADVKRLLAERPKAAGLAVPGMPIGSPGMEMDGRRDRYEVLLVRRDGTTAVFAKH